jgi:sec-independent protein translocase protein TatA
LLIGPLGFPELLLIVLVILLLFGGRKIPELMRSMGEGVREFKKASRELSEEEAGSAGATSESEKLREAAASLGISTEGKSDEQIKREIQVKVGGG